MLIKVWLDVKLNNFYVGYGFDTEITLPCMSKVTHPLLSPTVCPNLQCYFRLDGLHLRMLGNRDTFNFSIGDSQAIKRDLLKLRQLSRKGGFNFVEIEERLCIKAAIEGRHICADII